jgi:hypothetical protein
LDILYLSITAFCSLELRLFPSLRHLATMRDPLRSIAIWLIFCNVVRSANNSTNSTTDNNSQESLCGETFDQANAVRELPTFRQFTLTLMRPCKTGFFSFSPGILLPSQEQPPNFTWAVTLLGGVPQNTSLDYSFWYVLKT